MAFKLGIICGGPSEERGISLNSARSILDHVIGMDVTVYYVDQQLAVYQLPLHHVYSNTPEDFDFKLQTLENLSQEEWLLSMKEQDIIFPVIHGAFGEDGTLQSLLEKENIPFVGSGAKACQEMFFKDRAADKLSRAHYPTLPSCLVQGDNWIAFLEKYKKIVMKPQAGGSSIGVYIVETVAQAKQALNCIKGQVLCERFCRGIEFTVVVLNTENGPVALMPAEIDIDSKDGFFDYRRKYLPTSNTRWHCPARVDQKTLNSIRKQAERLFSLFNMEDFVRIDGWLEKGKVVFSDINPISGMEQNSFLFLQSSRVGMTHTDVVHYILHRSCQRQGIVFTNHYPRYVKRQSVAILLGGVTAERQVSLMSGTNVWLKLRQSSIYQPQVYLLDQYHEVWPLAYTYALNHTVEEIYENVRHNDALRQIVGSAVSTIRRRLGLMPMAIEQTYPSSRPMQLDQFIKKLKSTDTIFFNALHGGIGEDGTLQALLDKYQLPYNGSNPAVSALGMDKYIFSKAITRLNIPGVESIETDFLSNWADHDFNGWLILKPRSEGCSSNIEVVTSERTYNQYKQGIKNLQAYVVQPYIETDHLYYENNQLQYNKKTGWLELTLVVCDKVSWIPSITIAKESILSVEEKFQGGTGINITPPPVDIISVEAILAIRDKFAQLSQQLNVRHYVRYDFFYHLDTKKIKVIEMNTLPALTPATVLYQQMLAFGYAKSPQKGLEKLIELIVEERKETV